MSHPQRHLWPALQRRFADQNQPNTAPDRLMRGLCIVPLDGQEESATFSLGFREERSVRRTVSLARDFQALAGTVDSDQPCYIAIHVGDVELDGAATTVTAQGKAKWCLLTYVPPTCSAFEAKRMADNRAGLKAGLGDDMFGPASMWCVSPDQITLSSYMRAVEAAAKANEGKVSSATPGIYGRRDDSSRQELAASKIQGAMRRKDSTRRSGDDGLQTPAAGTVGGGVMALSAMGDSAVNAHAHAQGDATELIWEERIKGVRQAYGDSRHRLVGALEDLERMLCNLTGDEYRQEEPILRARAHLAKSVSLD